MEDERKNDISYGYTNFPTLLEIQIICQVKNCKFTALYIDLLVNCLLKYGEAVNSRDFKWQISCNS